MTVAEREALIEVLHLLVRNAFNHSGDSAKAELLETWRESYEVLCAHGACSTESEAIHG